MATTITNVVATLRGTQPESPDRVYVVSGHYDSRCTDANDAVCDAPGANDDASGVAAVLEAARVMATREFDATIVFMAVAGEEQGLFGSAHFAEQAKQQNVNVAGMFTNDIVGSSVGDDGRREPFTVRLFSEGVPTSETPQQAAIRRSTGGENDGPSRQLARYIKEAGENRATEDEGAADLAPRPLPARRRPDPVPRARLLGGALHRAQRELRPSASGRAGGERRAVRRPAGVRRLPLRGQGHARERVGARGDRARAGAAEGARILTARLTNDTDLAWQPNTEPDLAGYEVVWRDTTEPLWTHAIRVGNVTSYTVEGMSKDNFQFGVRAVDRDGNRSPVSFPLPG